MFATKYRTIEVDQVKVFYRESGPVQAPAVLLLHSRDKPESETDVV